MRRSWPLSRSIAIVRVDWMIRGEHDDRIHELCRHAVSRIVRCTQAAGKKGFSYKHMSRSHSPSVDAWLLGHRHRHRHGPHHHHHHRWLLLRLLKNTAEAF